MSETSCATAAELLTEGDRLVAEIHALKDRPDAGPELLRLYLQLKDVVARATALPGVPA